MIEVQHLSKRYGPFTAVDDVSFRAESGEILGFLGPNGAGKTTTMRIITGYMPATSGTAIVAGYDVFEQPIEAKRRTGYLPETPPLYPDMTVREYLTFVAKIKGVRQDIRGRVDEVMKRTWVADMADRHCGQLSKGYRQRVGLAQAIIHNPEVLVLDEPTAGLDPKQIIETRQLIRELAGAHTIVLSTHILPEVAQTCQRVVIINKGKVVAVDTPQTLTERLHGVGHDVRAGAGPGRGRAAVAAGRARGDPRARGRRQGRHVGFEVESEKGADVRRELAAAVVGAGWGLLELRPMRMSLEDIFLSLTTEEKPAEAPGGARPPPRRWPMRNLLAIAERELKSYFASPIAYVVIGFFALLFGYFFYALLSFFEQQSMQMGMGQPGQSMNINQMLIGPVLMNATVILLFVFPMITMRTYAEEKRSGTIELLLTSPLTDLQIILGKFLGAMLLYAAMLAVTLIHMALLFLYGDPEWKPIVTGYLGLLLMGGCFLSVGLFISSLTKNQIVAGMITFAVFLMLWVINWIGSFVGPHDAGRAGVPVDHRALRRLREGRHRHQAPHLLPELHDVRAVPDGEVGGQRTVAGLSIMKQITASSVGSARRWSSAPSPSASSARVEPVRHLRGVGGPGLGPRLHGRPVARHRRLLQGPRRPLRHALGRQHRRVPGHPRRGQLPGRRARTSGGT